MWNAAPSDAVRTSTRTGDVVLWEAAPGVVVHLVSGVLTLPLAVGIADFFRPILVLRSDVRSFADFRKASGYTRDAREFLADFTRAHISSFAAINILLGSKILAMGIGVYKLVVGDVVRTYADEDAFVQMLDAALKAP
jgi:hypothetical protein